MQAAELHNGNIKFTSGFPTTDEAADSAAKKIVGGLASRIAVVSADSKTLVAFAESLSRRLYTPLVTCSKELLSGSWSAQLVDTCAWADECGREAIAQDLHSMGRSAALKLESGAGVWCRPGTGFALGTGLECSSADELSSSLRDMANKCPRFKVAMLQFRGTVATTTVSSGGDDEDDLGIVLPARTERDVSAVAASVLLVVCPLSESLCADARLGWCGIACAAIGEVLRKSQATIDLLYTVPNASIFVGCLGGDSVDCSSLDGSTDGFPTWKVVLLESVRTLLSERSLQASPAQPSVSHLQQRICELEAEVASLQHRKHDDDLASSFVKMASFSHIIREDIPGPSHLRERRRANRQLYERSFSRMYVNDGDSFAVSQPPPLFLSAQSEEPSKSGFEDPLLDSEDDATRASGGMTISGDLHRVAAAESAQRMGIDAQERAVFLETVVFTYTLLLRRELQRGSTTVISTIEDATAHLETMMDFYFSQQLACVESLLGSAVNEQPATVGDDKSPGDPPEEPAASPVPSRPSMGPASTLAPSEADLALRLEAHKVLIGTGRNVEGERLRQGGAAVPNIRVEPIQDETMSWKISASEVSPPAPGGAASAVPGPHTCPQLDDYRTMMAYNFYFIGPEGGGKSSVAACMTSKAPKWIKKCPSVVSPTLGVTRTQHFYALDCTPTTLVSHGGHDTDDRLDVRSSMRASTAAFNSVSSPAEAVIPGADIVASPFTVSQPCTNGSFAVNFVEVPLSVLDLSAGAPQCDMLATATWHRPQGMLPSKGAIYFLVYSLTEDVSVSRRSLEKSLRHILACCTSRQKESHLIPFILIGTHSDVVECATSDSSHLQALLHDQRDWFQTLCARLQDAVTGTLCMRPILLDTYSVSCKDWLVSGERPRSANTFEDLGIECTLYLSLHSPSSPLGLVPALHDVALRGSFEEALLSTEEINARVLSGRLKPDALVAGSWSHCSQAKDMLQSVLSRTRVVSTCSLERYWTEAMSTPAHGPPDRGEKPAAAQVMELEMLMPSETPEKAPRTLRCATLCRGILRPTSSTAKRTVTRMGQLPQGCGLERRSHDSGGDGSSVYSQGGAGTPQQSHIFEESATGTLLLCVAGHIARAACGDDALPSGYLLEPVIRCVDEWLTCAPFGLVTLITSLKRFADVSSSLLDGQTLTYLVHQHLGMLPFAPSKKEGDSSENTLSPLFRAMTQSQYQQYQLYLEKQRLRKVDARRSKGPSAVLAGDDEDDTFADEILAATLRVDALTTQTDSKIRPEARRSPRHACPVVGLNSEKNWPPELIVCRTLIVERVVCELQARGVLAAVHTSPSTVLYSIGALWRDAIASTIAAPLTIRRAAMLPDASMGYRARCLHLGLISSKCSNGGSHAAVSTLMSANGYDGDAAPRSMAALTSRVREQGLFAALSPPSWTCSSGAVDHGPWSGTYRSPIAGAPIPVDLLTPEEAVSYFRGQLSSNILKALFRASLRPLASAERAATAAIAATGVTLQLLGDTNTYASALHRGRHFLACVNRVGRVATGAKTCAAAEAMTTELRNTIDVIQKRCWGADLCKLVPSTVDVHAPRALLDAAAYLIQIGCDRITHASISVQGYVPSVFQQRVFCSLGECVPLFVLDAFRDLATVHLLSAHEAGGIGTGDFAATATQLAASMVDGDPHSAASIRLWRNAAVFSTLRCGVWALVARDTTSDRLADAGSDMKFVVVTGSFDHVVGEGIAAGIASAISAAFIREAASFQGIRVMVEGRGEAAGARHAFPAQAPVLRAFAAIQRPIVECPQSPTLWSEEALRGIFASDDEAAAAAAIALAGSQVKLVTEEEYAQQSLDATVVGFAGQCPSSGIAAARSILSCQPSSARLYHNHIQLMQKRRQARDALVETAHHLREGTRPVTLEEVLTLVEAAL